VVGEHVASQDLFVGLADTMSAEMRQQGQVKTCSFQLLKLNYQFQPPPLFYDRKSRAWFTADVVIRAFTERGLECVSLASERGRQYFRPNPE